MHPVWFVWAVVVLYSAAAVHYALCGEVRMALYSALAAAITVTVIY